MFTVSKEINFLSFQECLVVGLYDKPVKFEGTLAKLDENFNGHLTELVKSGDISAKSKAISKVHTFGLIGAKRLIFVGLGKEACVSFNEVREAFGKAFKEIQKMKFEAEVREREKKLLDEQEKELKTSDDYEKYSN